MEEIVEKTVREVCEEEKRTGGSCTSPECCMDVCCFVLNRIPQQYVTSGRGVAHAEKTLSANQQILVDIVALVHEGFRRVSGTQRAYYAQGQATHELAGPLFCFPVIKGRLIDCGDFSPAKNVDVKLLVGGETVAMLDARWQNPFFLSPKIEGNYLFLPYPQPAAQTGEEKLFEFELRVDAPGFEPFQHFFKMGLVSEPQFNLNMGSISDYKLQELYLVREGEE
jgi:competence protein ComFB